MYSVCSFGYTLVSSFCAFLSFCALILVGFLLLHRDAVFTSACFFLTTVSDGTLDLALCLVCILPDAASMWVLTKFLYSSFGVSVSDISRSASNLFLCVSEYLSLISLLLSRAQSQSTVVVVRAAFLRRLRCILAVTIR